MCSGTGTGARATDTAVLRHPVLRATRVKYTGRITSSTDNAGKSLCIRKSTPFLATDDEAEAAAEEDELLLGCI